MTGSDESEAMTVAEARADVQARAAARAEARRSELDAHFATGTPGRPIIAGAVVSTAVFAVVTVISVAVDTRGVGIACGVFDVTLFAIGCAVFLIALYTAAQRSREAELTMGGWWFLTGVAPGRVRLLLLGSTAAQVVIGLMGASIRPFTPLAFGVLVPMLGLALGGLWGARHGMFPARGVRG